MATKMSQKEYLKKYLSGGSDKKKKKKDKKAKNRTTTVKIIDDDEHGGNHMEIDEELLLTGEDAPQIVGVIDISGENGESKKWKSIGCTGPEVKSEAEQADDDLWGKKATSSMRVKSPDRNRKAFEQSPTRRPNDIGKVRRISDQSPPRKRSNARGDQSPPRKQSPGKIRRNSDQSPPRRRSSPRMRRNIDKSPARRRSPSYSNRDSHRSPPRRRSPGRTRRDSDQSPRGKRSPAHSKRDFDQSPDRKKKNADISPPRRRSPAHSKRNSDQSPPRRRSPAHSKRDSDQSPPRRQSPAHLKRDSDQSPFRRRSPGRTRKDSDPSPPRRRPPASSKGDTDQHIRRKRSPGRSRWDSDQSRSTTQVPALNDDADLSPVRIKREKSTDQSPPRRRNNDNPFRSSIKVERLSPDSSTQRNRSRRDSDQSPVRTNRERISESPPPTHKPSAKMSKTLDGKRAGLQDARTLKLETEERRRQEDKLFNKMSSDISGRDAEVQVRQSSSYRRRRKDLEEDPEVQRKKAEHEQQKKELYDRWNKGLKQIEARKAKFSDDQYESTKPLARYSNDADLDEMLRHQERHDDPMLAYMRNKKKDQMKAANIPVMPKYNGSYPENRFGIPPGYRWDGVDRSNGYERKWFDVQNQKKALADEAYKYSTEDM